MPSDAPLLICALSARALAQSARKAGYAPVALDIFNDMDTRAAAARSCTAREISGSLDAEDVVRLAAACAPPFAPLLYGAGFERCPGLLKQLSAGRRILGNLPAVVSKVKDPRRFFPALEKLGIPYPEVSFELPGARDGWLCKQIGGAGGAHVRRAGSCALSADCYYQREIKGISCSAVFAADGKSALVLGFNEQWCAPAPRSRFRFGGAASNARLLRSTAVQVEEAVQALTAEFGLLGLNGLDFMVAGDGWRALEINPRPPATFELYDEAFPQGMVGIHIQACEGNLPEAPSRESKSSALAIVYCERAMRIPAGLRWPRWASDLPAPGRALAAGAPLCSVHAEGASAEAARTRAMERKSQIEINLEECAA